MIIYSVSAKSVRSVDQYSPLVFKEISDAGKFAVCTIPNAKLFFFINGKSRHHGMDGNKDILRSAQRYLVVLVWIYHEPKRQISSWKYHIIN